MNEDPSRTRSFAQKRREASGKHSPMIDPAGAPALWNDTRGCPVVRLVYQARSLWERAAGLLGRRPLAGDEALWLEPCGSIHTWGMAYAIDVVFLDRDHRVLAVARAVQPWKIAWAPRGTRVAVELRAGCARTIRPGDRLRRRSSAEPD